MRGLSSTNALSRRDFCKAALAIGGSSALSACIDRNGVPAVSGGPADLSSLPDRQFAWNEYVVTDPHGNTMLPHHQLVLCLEYAGEGTPTDDERATADGALRTLERAYQRGTGGNPDALSTEGLLFMMGYSRQYFDRFDAAFRDAVDLPPTDEFLDAIDADPELGEDYDAVLVLSSDHVEVLLAAEQALFGNLDKLNGVAVEDSLAGILERQDRRTGFLGQGVVAEELEDEPVPEEAPAAMGYKSGFSDNQASEDRVAIQSAPFTDGTTLHLSRIVFELDEWYDNDEETRVHQMFSPDHDHSDIGSSGKALASHSNTTEEMVDRIDEDAREHGRVGHAQRVARSRDDDFDQVILRRSEGVSTDLARTGMNFISIQREISDFVDVRTAMNSDDEVDDSVHEGILSFMEVLSRATFLIPPREHAALPTPNP